MKKNGKKLTILWLFLLMFIGINKVFAAAGIPLSYDGTEGHAALGFEVYNVSNYMTSEDTASMTTVLANYIQGNIPASYRINENGSIDPGKYILVVAKIDIDSGYTVRQIDYAIQYNDEYLTPIQYNDEYGFAYANDYPCNTDPFTGARTNRYSVIFSSLPNRSDGDFLKVVATTMDAQSDLSLNSQQNLSYHFLKVNDDAAGKSITLNYGVQQAWTDGSPVGGGRIYFNQVPITFRGSGGTTSNDNTLKSAQVSFNGTVFNFDSTTPFTPGAKEVVNYLTYVGDGALDIDFNLVANDFNSTITSTMLTDSDSEIDRFVSEDNLLEFGNNTYVFVVTAADGSVQSYTFNVYRLSNDATVSNIRLDGIELTQNGDTYTGLTSYSDKDTTVYVTTTHQNAKVSSGAGSWYFTSSGATVNSRSVVISAENCDTSFMSIAENTCKTKTYTIEVTRANASTDASLSDLLYGFNGDTIETVNGFSSGVTTYNLGNVPYSTDEITISGEVTDLDRARIRSGIGTFDIQVGSNTFEVVVLAEDETTTQTYKLNVYRYSDDRTLDSLTVTSNPSGTLTPTFTRTFEGTYKYGYDPTVTSVTISAVAHDVGKASVAVVDSTNGQPATYSSTITSASLTVVTPATTSVSVIVTSEDGGVRIYPITLERQQSNDNYLANLVVTYEKDGTQTASLSPTFAASTRSYTATIPADIDTVKITPTKASIYATIRKIGNTTGSDLADATISNLAFGDNNVEIIVYSESGNDNPYQLKIVRSKYNIATLDELSIGDGSFTTSFNSSTNNYTYSETIPYSQNTISINGTKSNSYASVRVSITDEKNNTQSQTITSGENNTFSGTLNLPTGTSTIGILVTAHDGTTNTYTISITRNKNNDSTVSNLRVDGQINPPEFDSATNTYTVMVPFSAVVITPGQVAVTTTDPNATVSKGNTAENLSTTIYRNFNFRVIAEDSTYTDYVVRIIKKQNSAALLTRVVLNLTPNTLYCDVDQTTKSCTVAVPVLTENFTMRSIISENATVSPANNTAYEMPPTESEKNIVITVTSEDGTNTNVYNIKIERTKSSDNTLSDLQVNGTTIDGFTTYGNSFSDIEGGTTSSVTIKAIVRDVGKASVSRATVNGDEVSITGLIENGEFTFDAPLNYGTNNIVITVTAENEQTQNYNVTVTRQQNETATIGRLDYAEGTGALTQVTDWDKDASSYTFTTVSYDVDKITLVAYPEDSTYGTAMVTKVEDENNNVTQTNLTNETSIGGQYKVTIPLTTGANTITLVGYAHNTLVTKNYILTIVRTKNNDNSISDVKVKNTSVTDNGDGTYTVTLPNSVDSITSSDVTYTLPAGATATVNPATLDLSTTNDNIVTITVTSEGGVSETYTINVVRTKSANADLSRVSLKIVSDDSTYNGQTYYCNFDTTTAVACTIDVPASTTAYTITSTLVDETASVVPANGTSDTMSSSESTKIIDLEVTAEDEVTKKQYTVTVRRTKSSNTNLSSLTVDGNMVVGFTPNGTLYYYEVDGDTTEVTVAATVEDPRTQIVNADTLAYPLDVDFGANRLEVNLKAEDGTEKTVYIQVTRKNRTDATLKEITVNGENLNTYDITPGLFDPDVEEYIINTPFDYSDTSVTIGAVVNDPDNNAMITSGIGTTSLQTGTTTITIHVIAHDITYYKDYKITLNRNKNNDTSISTISLAGNLAVYNSEEGVWEVTVPNSVDEVNSSNLIITPSPGATVNDKLATPSFDPTSLATGTTTDIPITITAEDGTIDNSHVLRVTRTKSSVATLSALSVTNGSFNPSFVPNDATKTTYSVTVPESANSINISATTTEPNATIVTGTGNFALTASTQTYQIHVQSEDGNNDVYYTLNVTRTKSSDNTLKLVTVTDGLEDFDVYNYDNNLLVSDGEYGSVSHYKVTVPGRVTEVTIGAVANDSRASVDATNLGNKTLAVGERSFTIKVTSESGATNTYTLTIIRERKSNNNLSTLKVDNVEVDGFDPEIDTYDIGEVGNEIASIIINAEAEDEDATVISGTGTQDLQTGDNTITVVVKAQNGDEKSYYILVRRTESSDNRLSILSVNGYAITPTYSYIAPPLPEPDEYAVTLKYSKSTFGQSDVNAVTHNNTATISYDPDITLATGETKTFNITVTAENGSINIYKLRVTRSRSDNAYLKAVSVTVGDGTKNATISPIFNKTTYEYTISIPYGETSFTITGEPEVDSTIMTGSGATYNIGDQDYVEITTYAEIYKVDGDETERNATQTYRFRVEQSQSNNAYLADLYVNGYRFNNPHPVYSQAYTNYDIGDIESDVTGLIINATPENSNATITYRVNSGAESTSNVVNLPSGTGAGTITITVTAPDGLTTIPYTITYNKVYGTNAYLLSLETDKGTMNPAFIKTTREYIISVDNEVDVVNLTMYTEKRSSNVSINGGPAVSATDIRPYTYTLSDLVVGDTPVTIISEAEDGNTALTYNIIIRKAQPSSSGDATLSSLSIDGHPYVSEGIYTSTSFAKDTSEYSIGSIPYSEDKVKIDYTTTQGESSISFLVNGRSVARDSNGYIDIPVEDNNNGLITVVVIAPNGSSSKTYNIHYRKKASSDAKLANLVVSEGTLTPTFDPDTLGYEVELPDGVDHETITVILSDPNAKLIVGDTERPSSYVHTLTGLGAGTHRVSFKVIAENNAELTYYVDVKILSGDETITSVIYGHTIENGMITTVAPEKTSLDFKNELDNDNIKLQIWTADESAQLNDGDIVGTGMIVKLINNDTEIDRKIIIIKGDTSGDGKINITDVVKSLNHYLDKVMLDGAYFEAAEVSDDAKVNITDVVKVLNHFLGKVYLTNYK